MLNFIVFSKNRACQLDLLLRSIKKYYLKSNYQVHILHTFTDSHKQSYEICKYLHNNLDWIEENNFEKHVKEFLSLNNICLLTDDTVFFKQFDFNIQLDKQSVFSWRLGYNTYVQDHTTGRAQPNLKPDYFNNSIIKWNPNNYPEWANYGYPFSLDGHVYPDGMLNFLKDHSFNTANDIEGILHNSRSVVTSLYSNLHSSCVNVPCNNLSGLTMFGHHYPYTMEYLRDAFVSNKKIRLISGVPILGCHQELEFEFYDI